MLWETVQFLHENEPVVQRVQESSCVCQTLLKTTQLWKKESVNGLTARGNV